VIRGFIGCPGAVESGPDGGSDGPRPVLAGQPDLGGGVGERLSGRVGVEVAVGDQFTGPQARPKQQPVPFAAAGGPAGARRCPAAWLRRARRRDRSWWRWPLPGAARPGRRATGARPAGRRGGSH